MADTEPQVADTEPRVLDTYALTYAFTALYFIAALFMVDTWSFAVYTPAYVVLLGVPFLLGPATVFLTDSKDGLRTVAIRTAVLVPLVALTGITFLFVAMVVVLIPLSLVLSRENFEVLTILSMAVVVLFASPLAIAFVKRIRGGLTAVGLFQMAALLACMFAVGWMLVMTFDPGHALAEFIRRDLVDHYAGAFTWYMPAFALAAGIWRRVGLV